MKATIVFQKIWAAIHATVCDPAGIPILDEDGKEQRYKYIILKGSSRSSKTASCLQAIHLYAIENANKRLTVWRDTKSDCRKTVLKDFQTYLPIWEGAKFLTGFNKTESIYQYKTGSTFEIHGTDDEVKVMGLNKAVAWLNEPYKISRDTFDQLDQRTEDFILIDYNPKEGHWVDDVALSDNAIVIHSTFLDNPFCPTEQRKKILSYQPISWAFAVIGGTLTEPEARIYDLEANPLALTRVQLKELTRCRRNEEQLAANEFNWLVYGLGIKAERPNRIFRWDSVPDSTFHALDVPVYTGCDWGINHPFAIVDCKYYDGALYVHERNYLSEVELQRNLLPADRAQIQANEEGLVTWLFRRLGIRKNDPIICDNNQPAKVGILRDAGYHAELADKRPGTILSGISMLNGIKVYYTASSLNIASEQENYSYLTDSNNVVTDVPIDDYNHCIDATRYVTQWLVFIGVIKIK